MEAVSVAAFERRLVSGETCLDKILDRRYPINNSFRSDQSSPATKLALQSVQDIEQAAQRN